MSQTGWICSRCRKSLAPFVRECNCRDLTEQEKYEALLKKYPPNHYTIPQYFPWPNPNTLQLGKPKC